MSEHRTIEPMSTVADIRARSDTSITDIVDNPREYYRVQTLLRDRVAMLAHYDRLRAALEQLMNLIQPLLDRPYGIAADEDAVVVAKGMLAGAADETSEHWDVPSGWRGKEPWFKVGDRVYSTYGGCPFVMTVTEITERGFKYTHNRWSLNPYQWTEGGETFEPSGYKRESENGEPSPP